MGRLSKEVSNLSIEQRFFRHVVKTKDCWNWIGTKNQVGRGQLRYNNKLYSATRLSYELHKGTVPKTLNVLHKCDNPNCVNPKHLFLGTQRDNMLDMVSKGRENTTKGEDNYFTKLTEKQVLEIRNRHKPFCKINGTVALSKEFNVTEGQIRQIVHRRSWKHLK